MWVHTYFFELIEGLLGNIGHVVNSMVPSEWDATGVGSEGWRLLTQLLEKGPEGADGKRMTGASGKRSRSTQ